MHILITNDDGPSALGLAVLRAAVRRVFPDARIVTLAPNIGTGGQALSITPVPVEDLLVEEADKNFFMCHGKPADLIYLGLGLPHRFLPCGQFDLVLTGVNHGQNVGMDVFHSGTVGMAMLAWGYFRVPAVAFSQELEPWTPAPDEQAFRTAVEGLPEVLQRAGAGQASCWSINFPASRSKGYRSCGVSMYSRFRPHLMPGNRQDHEDVGQLDQGYTTLSVLHPAMLAGGSPLNPAETALGYRGVGWQSIQWTEE